MEKATEPGTSMNVRSCSKTLTDEQVFELEGENEEITPSVLPEIPQVQLRRGRKMMHASSSDGSLGWKLEAQPSDRLIFSRHPGVNADMGITPDSTP